MTSSVRGLFVGGKSNSGNTRRTSQRTAPIAENQGGTSPLPDVNLPTEQLSPQASMQVAQLQAEKQEYVKNIQFPGYRPDPEPTGISDLQRLATSLGNFSANLGSVVQAGVNFEQSRNEQAKLHAEQLAAQGQAFGPFADYAALVRQLEKASTDPSLTSARQEQAATLLTELRARGNRIKPYITSEARVLGVQNRTTTLSAAQSKNPIIGQDDQGNDLYLTDVSADDPLYLRWADNHIFGDTILTPAEHNRVKGNISAARVNAANAHNAQVVKRQQEQYTQSFRQRMSQIGTEDAKTSLATGVTRSPEEQIERLQTILDERAFLGLPSDMQQDLLNDAWEFYSQGWKAAYDAEGAQLSATSAVELFKELYVGPVSDRKKADGTPNEALRWVNTQDADWAATAEFDLLHDQAKERKDRRSIQLQQVLVDTRADVTEIQSLLSAKTEAGEYDLASRRAGVQKYEELKRRLASDTSLDQQVVRQTISQLDKLFEDVDEAVYGKQLDDNYQEAVMLTAFVRSGAMSTPDFIERITEMKNKRELREDEYNSLMEKLPTIVKSDAALNEAFKTVDAEVKRVEGRIKDLESSGVSPTDAQLDVLYETRQRLLDEQGDVVVDYVQGRIATPEELKERVQAITTTERELDRSAALETFENYNDSIPFIKPQQNGSGALDMQKFNDAIRGNLPDRQEQLRENHEADAPMFHASMAVQLAQSLATGQAVNGYDFEAIQRILPPGIEPGAFMERELTKVAELARRSGDPREAEFRRLAKEIAGFKAPQKVSYVAPEAIETFGQKANQTLSAMLDVLLGAGPANAQMVPSQAEYRFAPPPGQQSISNLVKIALTAGFTPEEAAIAAAISMAESSGNPGAYNPDASTGDKSYGLWQINMLGGMGPERRKEFSIGRNEELWNPTTNAMAARKIYLQQGWGAWSVTRPYQGRPAAYLQYLPEARKALQTVLKSK